MPKKISALSPLLPVANWLVAPTISVAMRDRTDVVSLSKLLALLMTTDNVVRIQNITMPQRGPVWRFLVRCGTKYCQQMPGSVPVPGMDTEMAAESIAQVLTHLADGPAAWLLYNPVNAEPAFLQPPIGRGSLEAAKYTSMSPSVLALTLGGKAHEEKPEAIRHLSADQLAFSLITHQTGVIYTKGNYASQLAGSATGKGSGTPYVGVALPGGTGSTFRHDVHTMLSGWTEVASELMMRGKTWALWTLPWDGESSLGSEQLDPAFIPIARLIRVGPSDQEGFYSTIWTKPTKKSRVVDHTQGSGLGDPFLPLVPNPKQPGARKARGTMETGYRFDEVVRIAFGASNQTSPSPSLASLHLAQCAGDVTLRFEGIAFDQGKTRGFHHREVHIPVENLRDIENPERISTLHSEFLGIVKSSQAALRICANILLRGTSRARRGDDRRLSRGADLLQRIVDDHYIDQLLSAASAQRIKPDAGHSTAWALQVKAWAVDEIFPRLLEELPIPVSRRLERIVKAEAVLRSMLSKLTYPSHIEMDNEDDSDDA